MSVASKKSSKPIDRPFAPALLRKARAVAESYQIILHQEDGEYYGRSVELPNVMNDGPTPDKCVEATRDILTTAIAYARSPPYPSPPSTDKKRTEQSTRRDRRGKTHSGSGAEQGVSRPVRFCSQPEPAKSAVDRFIKRTVCEGIEFMQIITKDIDIRVDDSVMRMYVAARSPRKAKPPLRASTPASSSIPRFSNSPAPFAGRLSVWPVMALSSPRRKSTTVSSRPRRRHAVRRHRPHVGQRRRP